MLGVHVVDFEDQVDRQCRRVVRRGESHARPVVGRRRMLDQEELKPPVPEKWNVWVVDALETKGTAVESDRTLYVTNGKHDRGTHAMTLVGSAGRATGRREKASQAADVAAFCLTRFEPERVDGFHGLRLAPFVARVTRDLATLEPSLAASLPTPAGGRFP
jgi:hypothetical protein